MKILKNIFLLFVSLFVLSYSAVADENLENEIRDEIHHWGMIDEDIYRGAQPTERGIELLKQKGIKTVVNFRHEEDVIEQERQWVESRGMNYISLPWRIQTQPSDTVMVRYLETLDKKEQGPFFVHCRRGAERTGAAEAIYLYYKKGYDEKEAYEKSIEGYHTLFYWRPFIKKRIKGFIEDMKFERVEVENR